MVQNVHKLFIATALLKLFFVEKFFFQTKLAARIFSFWLDKSESIYFALRFLVYLGNSAKGGAVALGRLVRARIIWNGADRRKPFLLSPGSKLLIPKNN